MSPLVRRATLADLDRITQVYRETHDLHLVARPDTFKAASDDELSEGIRFLLTDTEHRPVWLAELAAQAVGYAGVVLRERLATPISFSDSWWELDQIGVLAAHRRSGVGRALVERIAAEARAAGVERLELSSWAFNQSAHRAFESYGFRPKTVRFELATDNVSRR
jgi:GNAT superfamily N-acetyltransferase